MKSVSYFPTLRQSTVKERFDKYGGITRYILTETDTWHESLEDAIANANLDDLQKSVGGPELLPATSHKLLQYDVELSSGYRQRTVRFASDYIAERIADKFLQDEENKSLMFLRKSAKIPTLASVRGSFFEMYAHKVLQGNGKWNVCDLSTHEHDVLKMNNNKIIIFDSLDKLNLQEGIYYHPKSKTFGALDALTKVENDIVLFQMTVSLQHPLHHAELKKHIAALSLNTQYSKIKLFHVVPPDIYPNFRIQPFFNVEGNEMADKNIIKIVKSVKQWVLQIPLTLPKIANTK